MTEAIDATAAQANRAAVEIRHWDVFKGLLWRQWLASRVLVVAALGVWLAGLWAMELFFHPGFILAFGVVYAFFAGPAFGASEAAEGSEEFAFSLPPTRGQRYLAALAPAAGTLLAFTTIGTLAVALDWPQALWGLVVSSGFTEPFPAVRYTFLYPLAVAVPFAVLAFSFTIGSLASSRGMASGAGILGVVAAGAVLGISMLLEAGLWQRPNGVLSVPALAALGAGALEAGYLLYRRKEGVSRPAPLGGRRAIWIWLLIASGVVAAMFAWSCSSPVHGNTRTWTEREAAVRVESPTTSQSAPADRKED